MNKIKDLQSMFKTVDYFGHQLIVHDWAEYVACDDDGCVYEFSQEPMIFNDYARNPYEEVRNYWFSPCQKQVASCSLDGVDWKETLVKV